jgi:hypothetical protein
MSGPQLVERIRPGRPNLAVINMSGYIVAVAPSRKGGGGGCSRSRPYNRPARFGIVPPKKYWLLRQA